jgi:hypothetical protein
MKVKTPNITQTVMNNNDKLKHAHIEDKNKLDVSGAVFKLRYSSNRK